MKLSQTLWLVCLSFISGAVLAANPNIDPRCEGLTGAAFGLCNAATSMNCDDPQSAPNGCDRVADNFTQMTGETPPWTAYGCANNSDCAADELCRTPDGSCDSTGVCEKRPTVCYDAYVPVCTCDGVTTADNECYGRFDGYSIYYEGECGTDSPPVCGGVAGFECPSPLVCVDDPSDNCDPAQGGADCGGICVGAL